MVISTLSGLSQWHLFRGLNSPHNAVLSGLKWPYKYVLLLQGCIKYDLKICDVRGSTILYFILYFIFAIGLLYYDG